MIFEQFYLWTGVVKDRNDPLHLGRCRVKINGINTGEISTLPWAQVIIPITAAPMSGVGVVPVGIVEGTTVVGFFRDGKTCQDPVIIGSLPGYNVVYKDTLSSIMGDERDVDTRKTHPRTLDDISVNKDGTGILVTESAPKDEVQYIPAKEEGDVEVDTRPKESRYPLGDGIASKFPKTPFLNRPDNPAGYSLSGVSYIPKDNETGSFKKDDGITDETVSILFRKKDMRDLNVPVAQFTGLENLKINIPDDLSCNPETQDDPTEPPPNPNIEGENNSELARGDVETGQYSITLLVGGKTVTATGQYQNGDTLESVLARLTGQTQSNNVSFNRRGDKVVITSGVSQDIRVEKINDTAKDLLGIEEGQANAVIKPITSSVGGGKPLEEDFECIPEESPAELMQLATSIKAAEGAEVTYSMDWSEPETQTHPKYPFNKVFSSESGHVIEIDDTPSVERLSFNHRTGSFYEIHPDGSTIQKVVGDNYTIVLRNNYVHVEGEAFITTDKGAKLLINSDRISEVEETAEGQKFNPNFDILVGSGANVNIKIEKGNLTTYLMDGCNNTIIENGDSNIVVNGEGNINFDAHDGNINIHASKKLNIYSGEETQIHAVGDIRVLAEKNACVEVKENADVKVGGNLEVIVDGTTNVFSAGEMRLESKADVYIVGKTVNIN